MTDASAAAVEETIKPEGDKFVLYSKDGTKKLGTHPTRAAAEKQEAAVQAGKAREGFARDVATGELELLEGGRYELCEDDIARTSDGNLKKLRAQMVEKRNGVRAAHNDLAPDQRYGSPEGASILDDLYYYNMVVSRLESELACRLLPLD